MSCLSCTFICYLSEEDMKEKMLYMLTNYSLSQYAYILHNMDDDIVNGNAKIHYHVYLRFSKQVRQSTIAKVFDIHENLIQSVKNLNGLIAYFVHSFDKDKYQYNPICIESFNLDVEMCIDNALAAFSDEFDETYHIRIILDKLYPKEWSLSDVIDYCLINKIWDLFRKNYNIFKDAYRGYL